MYEIEAKIKKNTINDFVKLIAMSPTPYIHIKSIQFLASELCAMLDDKIDKSKEENDIFG